MATTKAKIASAWIQLRPSMDGFFREIDRSNARMFPQMGARAGNLFGSSFGTAWDKLGLATKITGALAGVGAAIGTGLVLKGGWDRALNIQDAQAKLKGLGYQATQIKGITDDVIKAVVGTKYSLDDALGVGASALATGISQGEPLTEYLQAIADTAQITGRSMTEVGMIFNSIQGLGVAQTQDLKQLAMAGLPIFAWLAEQKGVAQSEVQDLISKGEVSSADFLKAIQDNIEGAALASADTVRGSVAGMEAAWARLGAAVVGGSLGPIQEGFKLLNPYIDLLTTTLKPVADAFWALVSPVILNGLKTVFTYLTEVTTGARPLPGFIMAIGGFFQTLFSVIVAALPTLGLVIKSIWEAFGQPAIALLGVFLTQIKDLITGTEGSNAAFTEVGNVLQNVWLIVTQLLSGIVNTAERLWLAFGPQLTDLFYETAGALGEMSGKITFLPALFDALYNVLSGVITLFIAWHPVIWGVLEVLIDVATSVAGVLLPILSVLGFSITENTEFFNGLIWVFITFKGVLLAVSAAIKIVAAVTWVVNAATRAWAIAQGLLTIAMLTNPIGLIIGVVVALAAAIIWVATQTTWFQDAWKGFGALFGLVGENIAAGVDFLVNAFKIGFMFIGNFVQDIFNGIINGFYGFINMITSGINILIDMLNSLQVPVPEWAQGMLGGATSIGFDIPTIPQIPMLATGANILGPTLAMIGEKRPETVTDLGLTNRTLASVLELVDDVRAGGVGGSTAPIVQNFHLPEETNVEVLATRLERKAAIRQRVTR